MFDTVTKLDLQLFAEPYSYNANTTSQTQSGQDMSPTMKAFYDTALLENARDVLVFNQFGDEQSIKGNKVEWRKFNTFDKALTPLTEGVTPSGQKFGMTKIEATTSQHGTYTTVTDRLELESYDDIIYGATEEMGASGGATLDTLTRNVLIQGNSVLYAPTSAGVEVTSRAGLDGTCLMTPQLVHRGATWLKKNLAPKINGCFVCLIHPSVAHDLTETDEWKSYHIHTNPTPIFKGEIGEMHGVRFVESNECKVHAKNAKGVATYDSIMLGYHAYGVIKPNGESMKMIIKPKEVAGGPLELYSTIGYKFCHGAKILYEERMLRIETSSSFGTADVEN